MARDLRKAPELRGLWRCRVAASRSEQFDRPKQQAGNCDLRQQHPVDGLGQVGFGDQIIAAERDGFGQALRRRFRLPTINASLFENPSGFECVEMNGHRKAPYHN